MTCKDCIHYELCFDYTHLKHSKNLPDNREDVCEHFKNKANFVELPCKVGDGVYAIYLNGKLKTLLESDKITQVIINRGGFHFKCWWGYFHLSDIGKTVFLTKEEAEQKLKEGVQE